MPIIFDAPAALAPINAAKPVPPNPTTATVEPTLILAVLNTAPAPVITAHPKRAASSKGRDFSTLTRDFEETTVNSEKQETPT